jgi:hypothetical protein
MPLYIVEGAMKSIAERAKEMKGKGRINKGGNRMKRIVIAVLVAVSLVSASNAFAYWKSPVAAEVCIPTAYPVENI